MCGKLLWITQETQEELTVFTHIFQSAAKQCAALFVSGHMINQIDVIATQNPQKVQLQCKEQHLLKSLLTVTTVISVPQTVAVNAALFSQGLGVIGVLGSAFN